ncbi:hypothetical protein JCM6882_001176 [Rhodosporidiobolus microsporus]
MPSEAGIPPEIVDKILSYVQSDTRTLLSCCRASRGFSARVIPLLYRDLDILYLTETRMAGRKRVVEYHLSRSSALLLDALYVNPSLGKYCAQVTIKTRPKELSDMVRLRTEPTVESMTELFERLPYAEELVGPSSSLGRGLGYDPLSAAIAGALPALGGPTKALRRLKVAHLDDTTFPPLLQCPNLVRLDVGEARTNYPPPANPRPPFHLESLSFRAADDALFAYGTSNSHDSLVHLSAPFSFPFAQLASPFRNLTDLTITFADYAYTDSHKRSRLIGALNLYLSTDSILRTLTLSNSDGTPRANRLTLLDSLPPRVHALLLSPFDLLPDVAVEKLPNWPASLKKVRWTAGFWGNDWTVEQKETVEEACRAKGIEEVEFVSLDEA